MGDLNDDTPRRAQTQPRSTVGGIFQGFRVETKVLHLSLGKPLTDSVSADLLIISTDVRNSGAISILDGLVALFMGTAEVYLNENTGHRAFLDSEREWLHLARREDMWASSGRLVAILHPEDSHSLLILENTENGLHVDPQGRWQQEIGGQIGKLAAQWALANRPAKPPKRSGWKEPRNTGWSDGFI